MPPLCTLSSHHGANHPPWHLRTNHPPWHLRTNHPPRHLRANHPPRHLRANHPPWHLRTSHPPWHLRRTHSSPLSTQEQMGEGLICLMALTERCSRLFLLRYKRRYCCSPTHTKEDRLQPPVALQISRNISQHGAVGWEMTQRVPHQPRD